VTHTPDRLPQGVEKYCDIRKNVVVNGDDIGMNPAVDNAVAELAGLQRLSSASVMSLGTPAAEAMKELDRMRVSLGLHLDFTSSMYNKRYNCSNTLRSLIADSWSQRLDSAMIKERISEQVALFEAVVGRPPVFIDGHQHVHQFPTIRDSLIHVLQTRYPSQRLYLRNTIPSIWRGWKAQLIGELGGRALRHLANQAGYQYNHDFCGAYDFSLEAPLPPLWHSWLASLPSRGGLVMCHPGLPTIHGYDSVVEARAREFAFLRSEQFSDLISEMNVDIVEWDSLAH
jgi:predicted glycoside hydrolase/deacetylase ChbG (UPF0249 family)